jgi:hypothetical protein
MTKKVNQEVFFAEMNVEPQKWLWGKIKVVQMVEKCFFFVVIESSPQKARLFLSGEHFLSNLVT